MSTPKRKQLTQDLNKQIRLLTGISVIFSKVIADKAGQHSTDLECLDFEIDRKAVQTYLGQM